MPHTERRLSAKAEALRNKKCAQQPQGRPYHSQRGFLRRVALSEGCAGASHLRTKVDIVCKNGMSHTEGRLSAKAEALRNKKCARQPRPPLPQPEILPVTRRSLLAPMGRATSVQSGNSMWKRMCHPLRRLSAKAGASFTQRKMCTTL